MARARARGGRTVSEISEVILAEWYRVLPETSGGTPLPMDEFALTAAFNEILDEPCQAVLDVEGEPIKIIVPLPPAGVETKDDLDDYILNNGDFVPGMGAAVVFGCGR